MSKSIYEVASRKIDDMFDSWDRGVHQDSIEIIEEALEQAQKQEKLLELYRELTTVKDELISIAWFESRRLELEEIETDLEKQIKELENE